MQQRQRIENLEALLGARPATDYEHEGDKTMAANSEDVEESPRPSGSSSHLNGSTRSRSNGLLPLDSLDAFRDHQQPATQLTSAPQVSLREIQSEAPTGVLRFLESSTNVQTAHQLAARQDPVKLGLLNMNEAQQLFDM